MLWRWPTESNENNNQYKTRILGKPSKAVTVALYQHQVIETERNNKNPFWGLANLPRLNEVVRSIMLASTGCICSETNISKMILIKNISKWFNKGNIRTKTEASLLVEMRGCASGVHACALQLPPFEHHVVRALPKNEWFLWLINCLHPEYHADFK